MGVAPADRLFWATDAGPYVPYRGAADGFEAFMTGVIGRHAPSDLVMLGDGRLYHKAAIAAARTAGSCVTPWIVEHGYLRPNLVVVEPWGTGGRSTIPGAFARFDGSPAPAEARAAWPGSFLRYAALDVACNLANLGAAWALYPRYEHHALDGVAREYAGWIDKARRRSARRRGATASLARIESRGGPRFIYPLQLETDFQLRDHGTGKPQRETLRDVLRSFADHAPPDASLVVKEHPLDNGLARWDRIVPDAAREAGVANRVIFLDGGSVEALLPGTAGVVTVNSTVGLTALSEGVPVHVMGRAIYALPRLTDPQPLDGFWSAPAAPDARETACFVAFLRERFHVPGAFDGPGAIHGANAVARHLARQAE